MDSTLARSLVHVPLASIFPLLLISPSFPLLRPFFFVSFLPHDNFPSFNDLTSLAFVLDFHHGQDSLAYTLLRFDHCRLNQQSTTAPALPDETNKIIPNTGHSSPLEHPFLPNINLPDIGH